MADPIDKMLHILAERPESRDLRNLEPHVWNRIADGKGANVFGANPWSLQLAMTGVALLVGLAVAQFDDGSPTVRAEFALSSDQVLQPSVLLMGGT
jgi:hypothetical protein